MCIPKNTITPRLVSSKANNIPELAPVPPQTVKQISNLLLDWMDQENLNMNKAADCLGIGNDILLMLVNGYKFNDKNLLIKLSNMVPGIRL